MALIAKDGGGKGFDPVGEGLHQASCVAVVDLGEQYSKLYDNTSQKVLLTFEVHDENIIVDGETKPRLISKDYTLSLGEKATLRAHLESWRGKKFTDAELDGFDMKNVLGKPCQIQVLHSEKGGKTYANIASIVSWPRGFEAPQVKSEILYYDMQERANEVVFERLPEWVQKRIMESETWKQKDFVPDDDTPDFLKDQEVV